MIQISTEPEVVDYCSDLADFRVVEFGTAVEVSDYSHDRSWWLMLIANQHGVSEYRRIA